MNSGKKVVTRFAPSPTGFMHVGGVRTALYAFLWARKNNGTFILRIEDTDKKREVDGSADHIIAALRWVGIEWDEGPDVGGPNAPYLQSERLDSHKKYAQQLIDKGLAYADPYTEEQLETFRKQAEEKHEPFLYRNHRPENPPLWDGSQPLRLKIENIKSYEWSDVVRGDLSAGVEALDDFVLIKSDGYPTYNFAHIIDDLEMGVTHIIRTDEFIASTPKFLALYEALGIEHPEFVTLPPIMGPEGKKKLGKRDGAKDTLEYKADGYLPEAMMNFLAFLGWNPGDEKEIFSKDELIAVFELSRIGTAGPKLNEDKLKWMNKEHLKKLSIEEQMDYVKKFLSEAFLEKCDDEKFARVAPDMLERIHVGHDIIEMEKAGELSYVVDMPVYNIDLIFWKAQKDNPDKKSVTKGHLEQAVTLLESASFGSVDAVKSAIWAYAEEVGRGEVLWPMRVALSGQEKSPDPFTLAYILGKDETVARLKNAISQLS